MQSLRDKLLKAGLVSEDAAKKSESEAKSQGERKSAPREPKAPRTESNGGGGAPSGVRTFRPESADARIPKLPPLAGTAAANRAASRQQLENDRKIRERVLATQVAQEPGATTFYFATRKNKLRRLDLSEAQAKLLQEGKLAVVERPDPDKIEHALVPPEVALELKGLSEKVVRFLNQGGAAVGFLTEEEIHARAHEASEAEASEAAPNAEPATEAPKSDGPMITVKRAPLAGS